MDTRWEGHMWDMMTFEERDAWAVLGWIPYGWDHDHFVSTTTSSTTSTTSSTTSSVMFTNESNDTNFTALGNITGPPPIICPPKNVTYVNGSNGSWTIFDPYAHLRNSSSTFDPCGELVTTTSSTSSTTSSTTS